MERRGEAVTSLIDPTEVSAMVTSQARIATYVAAILDELGYDRENEHMVNTPDRHAKFLLEFAQNEGDTAAAKLLEAVFEEEHDSLVVVGPIAVKSMCAHHMVPVTGDAFVGYIPKTHVVGLSKLARVVHYYARQFTVQERITQQVVNILMQELEPLGAMCVIDAEHGCMHIRGVEEPKALTTTSAIRGVFKEDPHAKDEFLRMIQPRRRTQ